MSVRLLPTMPLALFGALSALTLATATGCGAAVVEVPAGDGTTDIVDDSAISPEGVLWGGDLNLHPDDVGLNSIYHQDANSPNNRGNTGRYREADDNDPNHCRGYGERSLPGTTGGPCREGGKIDFLFARQNRIVDGDYSGDTFNIPGDCTGACSDHRPVFGRFKVRVRLDP